MREFFDLDGPFFRVMNKLVDMVILSMIFLISCLPIITIGASWSALYYVAHKNLRHNNGYVVKEFFSAFAANFKKSTICFLLLGGFAALLIWETWLMYQYAKAGDSFGKYGVILMILLALVAMWAINLFPYISRFENTIPALLKNSFVFTMSNSVYSVALLMAAIVCGRSIAQWPLAIALVPSVYMLICEFFLEKNFKKYMSEDDLAMEEKRNRDYSK